MLFIVVSAGVLLFSLPYDTKAVESASSSSDWMNGSVTGTFVSDQAYVDRDQYTYGNVPCEYISKYAWGWQSNGWNSWKVRTKQEQCAVATTGGYVAYRQISPYGSEYWQALDLSSYNQPNVFPNPGSNGLAVVTNSYRYHWLPTSLYYTTDVFSTFNQFSIDTAGTVVRSPSKEFEHKLAYADGRLLQLTTTDGISYSANGRWMYVNVNNVGQLRIDTNNFSVLSFDLGYASNHSTFTSTTNSGNTVATYSNGRGLKLYDLTNCQSERPDYGSRNCASRDITQVAQNASASIGAEGPVYIVGVKFQTESRLRLTLQYRRAGETKTGFMDLEVSSDEQVVRYLALGDSFSSGEGAGNYYETTNFWAGDNDYNYCHQSRVAYSELLNSWLKPELYDSAACSGAVANDVAFPGSDDNYINYGPPQARRSLSNTLTIQYAKQSNLPGYIPQASFLAENLPNIVTISIGGNDIGFKDIIISCVANLECYSSRDDREKIADLIASKLPKLAATFATIKQNMSGNSPKLYVLGYPHLFAEASCGNFMNIQEQEFANHLVDYLNATVKLAAAQAGVFYVDVSSAFVVGSDDHRLCGNASQAANGVFFDANNMPNGPVVDALTRALVSSYHPNTLGHQLLAGTIRQQTQSFTKEMPMPGATSERPSMELYKALVGDVVDTYTEIGSVSQSITQDVVVEQGQSVSVSYFLGRDDNGLPVENATITVVAQSTPTTLGTLAVQNDGTASGNFALPSSLEPGMHTIHLLYNDINGQAHDIYQYVYVVASESDFDGDGIPNAQESCVIGGAMGVDRDNNGVDDACDSGKIVETDDSKNSETSTTVGGNTQNSNLQHGLAQESPVQLTDANLYFSAAFNTQTVPSLYTEQVSISAPDKAIIQPSVSRKTNTPAYVLLSIAMLIIAIGIILFIKHKRF